MGGVPSPPRSCARAGGATAPSLISVVVVMLVMASSHVGLTGGYLLDPVPPDYVKDGLSEQCRACAILVSLADQERKGSECWPSVSTSPGPTGMDARSVIRHLSKLEESGHISRSVRGGEGKGRKSNFYTLAMPEKPSTQSDKVSPMS